MKIKIFEFFWYLMKKTELQTEQINERIYKYERFYLNIFIKIQNHPKKILNVEIQWAAYFLIYQILPVFDIDKGMNTARECAAANGERLIRPAVT